jgi:hypothetical protein
VHEPPQSNTFFIAARDVGMSSVRVELSEGAWALDRVEVVNNATGETVVFPCASGWLDAAHGLVQMLYPEGDSTVRQARIRLAT